MLDTYNFTVPPTDQCITQRIAEPSMIVMSAFGAFLDETSNFSRFFNTDFACEHLISPVSVNIDVGIGASSYARTSLMSTSCELA